VLLCNQSQVDGGRVLDTFLETLSAAQAQGRWVPDTHSGARRLALLPQTPPLGWDMLMHTPVYRRALDLLPYALMLGAYAFMLRMGGGLGGGGKGGGGPGGMGRMFTMGKAKPNVFNKDTAVKVTFKDVAGIEEYQSMQWQVRQFLCDRTGYNLEPQELRIPDWLTLEVFDALDQYYGWTRQPVTLIWVRRQNDWMARVRREAALGEMPPEARKRAVAQESKAAAPQQKGSQIWLWIGAGILISQIVRFIGSAGGGG
jgi:hypothetical protein